MDELRNAVGEEVYLLHLDNQWTWVKCELVSVGNRYSFVVWAYYVDSRPELRRVLTENLFVTRSEAQLAIEARNK